MRRATTFAISAAVLPGLLALAACSGSSSSPSAAASNTTAPAGGPSAGATASSGAAAQPTAVTSPYGNVGLSSAALNAAMVAAAGSATSVHITGTVSSQSQSIGINVQLNKDGTSAGAISSATGSIPFVSTGGVLYMQATPNFISLTGLAAGSPAVTAIQNKWVPSTDKDATSVADGYSVFMSMSAFVAQSIASGDTYVAAGTGTVNGQTVANYKDMSEGNGALVLSVPVSGPVLPVQDAESGSGSMSFVWNEPSKISPPPAGQIYTGS